MSNVEERCGGDPIIAKTAVGGTSGEGIPKTNSSRAIHPKRHRMTKPDYEKMVQYLEDPEHFANLHSRKRVEGRLIPRCAAFAAMAVHLTTEGFPPLTGPIIRKKLDRYVEGYRKACEILNNTGGAGLTEVEIQSGMTLEDKLNVKCPFFYRMHALFGRGASVGFPAFKFCPQSNIIRLDDRSQAQLVCQTNREPIFGCENATTLHDTGLPSACVEKETAAQDVQLDAHADAVGGGGETVPNGEEIRGPVCKTSQVEGGAQEVISYSGSTPAGQGDSSPSEVKEVGVKEKSGRCVTCGDAVTKRHVIQLYQEAAKQQVEFRYAMSESREKLARECMQKEVKKMRIERSTLVVIEMARAGKTVEEIKQMTEILKQVESRLHTDSS